MPKKDFSLKGSYLLNFYLSLSNKELKSLNDFISSPFFNKDESVLSLHCYFIKHLPFSKSTDLDKQHIIQTKAIKKVNSVKQLNHVISYLMDLIKQFYAYSYMQSNDEYLSLFACKQAFNKNDSYLLEKVIKQRGKQHNFDKLENQFHLDYEYAKLEFKYHDRNCTSVLPDKFLSLTERFKDERDYKNLYIELLKPAINDIYNTELPHIELEIESTNKFVGFLHKIYSAYILKNISLCPLALLAEIKLLDLNDADKRFVCTKVLDFLIHEEMIGDKIHTKARFEFYKYMIELNLLVDHAIIPNHLFDSVVHQACLLNEYEFAIKFVQKYKQYLLESVRDETVNFYLGMINIYQENYEAGIRTLLQIKTYDFKLDLKISGLLLKAYYNMDEEKLFENCANSLKKRMIRNNKISESLKEQMLNFLSLGIEIMKMKQENDGISNNQFENVRKLIEQKINEYDQLIGKADIKKEIMQIV